MLKISQNQDQQQELWRIGIRIEAAISRVDTIIAITRTLDCDTTPVTDMLRNLRNHLTGMKADMEKKSII